MSQRTSDYKINDTTFRVTYGDLTKIKADVLVSSDDNYLSMGGGVSWALRNAGGEVIQIDARKHTPLNIGDTVVTSAGHLSAKYGIDVPLHLENAIEDTEREIERTETLVQETRKQLTGLVNNSA